MLTGLVDADILIPDEPYQGFDRGTYLDFREQVFAWRDRGKAILVATHVLNQLDQVDTVLELPSPEGAAA